MAYFLAVSGKDEKTQSQHFQRSDSYGKLKKKKKRFAQFIHGTTEGLAGEGT